MKFALANIHYDGPLVTRWDVLLRIVADFSILVERSVLYSEVEFCVVEFAVQLAEWLGRLGSERREFVYTSMESDVEGLVRFTPKGADHWCIATAHQARPETRTFTTDELRRAALEFIHELRVAVQDRVDILDIVDDERARAAVLAARD
ncbi:MAG: hypothetical protein IT373_24045 [Polyangiaceae bacterium]|nr:hypothetical protein [Polyangiaceae bacterium]